MSAELYHFGRIGQKWGVRRGPPYPIDDKILRKGTKLNSVSPIENSSEYRKNGRWMYTFKPEDEWDSKVYKGPFSYYKSRETDSIIYEHSYEVVKDLKMPTKKERIDEFIELYKNHKIMTSFDLKREQSDLKTSNRGSDEAQNINVWKLKTEEDFKIAYEIFNHAMENVNSFKTTKSYAKIMSEKYDAMVDDNNQEVYNGVHDPIIIFRANEALKEIGQARWVDMNEIAENYNYVKNERAKLGKAVYL